MEYSILDKFRMFALLHRKIVVSLCTFMIISVLVYVYAVGYSSRIDNQQFDEIQGYLEEIRNKDREIYNNVEVRILDKKAKGIDVSSWQGDINWDKVKASGIDFVMIRCGFRNLTNEEIHVDKKFHYNISEANRVGIPVGIYFYSTAINSEEVIEEASLVLNQIKDYDVTYPIAYDFEMFDENRTEGVSDKKINNNAVKFLDYIRAHGYHGMMYTNLNDLQFHWNMELFEGFRIWYAQYAEEAFEWGHYDIWQYADNGRIDGIIGGVDLNESYVTYERIN